MAWEASARERHTAKTHWQSASFNNQRTCKVDPAYSSTLSLSLTFRCRTAEPQLEVAIHPSFKLQLAHALSKAEELYPSAVAIKNGSDKKHLWLVIIGFYSIFYMLYIIVYSYLCKCLFLLTCCVAPLCAMTLRTCITPARPKRPHKLNEIQSSNHVLEISWDWESSKHVTTVI